MTVFTVSKTRGSKVGARARYFEGEQTDQAGCDDYYLKAGSETRSARYLGSALSVAGVKEGQEPEPGDYEKMFNGYRLDGSEDSFISDSARTNLENNNRVHGYSTCFSVDKSISVFYVAASKEEQAAILKAMHDAAEATIRYAEKEGKFTVRNGHAGQGGNEPAKIMAASYAHITSRSVDGKPPDEQLHTHVEIANFAVTESGDIKALDAHDSLYKRQAELRAIHDVAFYKFLEEAGIDVKSFENDFMGYGLLSKAVSEEQKQASSNRRQQILGELDGRYDASAHAKSKVNLSVRSTKAYDIDYEELHSFWRERVGELNLDAEGNRKQPTRLEVENVLFKGRSVTTINDLERTAAQLAIGDPRGVGAIEEKKQDIIRELGILYCKDKDKITTQDFVLMEGELLRYAIRQRESTTHNIDDADVKAGIDRFQKRKTQENKDKGDNRNFILNAEQEKAVYHLSKGGFAVMQGAAGTGKSASFGAVQEVYKGKGYTVTGIAPSGKAAEGLGSDGIDNAQTVHKLLLQIESGKRKLTNKDLILFDEAGMADTRTLHALKFYANQAGAKLVAAGDNYQLEAVGSASSLSMVSHEDAAGQTELVRIARQNHEEDRAISHAWLKGKPGEAWEMSKARVYDNGRSQVLACGELSNPDPDDPEDVKSHQASADALATMRQDKSTTALDAAANGYLNDLRNDEANGNNGGHVLLLADSRANVGALNRLIREQRIEAGEVDDASSLDFKFDLGRDQYRAERMGIGDRVMFRKPDKELGVVNGTAGKVIGRDKLAGSEGRMRDVLTVQLDNGKTTHVSQQYQGLELSYATTVHKSQGMTVTSSHYLASDMASRRAAYVAATRAKEWHTTYLDADSAGRIEKGVREFSSKESAIHAVNAGYETVALQEWERQARIFENQPGHEKKLSEIQQRIEGLRETIELMKNQTADQARMPGWAAQSGGYSAMNEADQDKAQAAHAAWQAGDPAVRTFSLHEYVNYVQERHSLAAEAADKKAEKAREKEASEQNQEVATPVAEPPENAVSAPRYDIITQLELGGHRMPADAATETPPEPAKPEQSKPQPTGSDVLASLNAMIAENSDQAGDHGDNETRKKSKDRLAGQSTQAAQKAAEKRQDAPPLGEMEVEQIDVEGEKPQEPQEKKPEKERDAWSDAEDEYQRDRAPASSNDGPELG